MGCGLDLSSVVRCQQVNTALAGGWLETEMRGLTTEKMFVEGVIGLWFRG